MIDWSKDPVFGDVALELRARSLGSVDRSVSEGSRRIEITVCTAAIRADTFESVIDLEEGVAASKRHVLERRDAAAGRTHLVLDEGQLATDHFFFPGAEALYEAHLNRVRAHVEPVLMGVVNVTPDSFSDGALFLDPRAAIEHGLELARQGARILDVGGESTRPGSEPVDAAEELRRVLPVVHGLSERARVQISIDTTKAEVARECLAAGASIVNDVSAGRFDAGMLEVVAGAGAGFIAMHMLGIPRDMQIAPSYFDVVGEVTEFLRARCRAALEAGVERSKLWIDPGIGFGKTLEHNLELLNGLHQLRCLGVPIVLGVSRKAFIATIEERAGLTRSDATQRLGGTLAALTVGVQNGAAILRVHDVREARQAALVARALAQFGSAPTPCDA